MRSVIGQFVGAFARHLPARSATMVLPASSVKASKGRFEDGCGLRVAGAQPRNAIKSSRTCFHRGQEGLNGLADGGDDGKEGGAGREC